MTAPAPVGRAPQRVLLVVAVGVLVVAVPATVLGGWLTGVSWDETYHVMRLTTFLEHGWYLLERDMLGSEPGPWEDQQYVYGPATTLLLHAWSVLWGVEGWSTVSASATAYAVRHLGVTLLSLVGVAATAALARLALGSWRWGLVAAAALVAVPTWSGHAMFNVKDVSVATGYTLVTLGLAWTARRDGPYAAPAALALVVAGVVLAVGTRPGIAPGLVVAALVTMATRDRWRWWAVPAAGVVAGFVLWAVYPALFSDPVTALWRGALTSSRFDDQQGAWWYLPLFLVVELPTLHLLLGAVGVVAATLAVRRSPGPTRLLLTLVLLQALLLPLLGVLRQANLYTGLRQLLFAAPALAVLVAVAIAALTTLRPRPWVSWLAAATLVLPVLAQLQLFPYGYAYRSPVALVGAPLVSGHDPSWELQTDYWRTSVRELAPAVPSAGAVICSPSRDDDGGFRPYSHESHDDCAGDPVGPLMPYAGGRAGPGLGSPTQFAAVVSGSDRDATNCAREAEVTRRLWWRELTMSWTAVCDLEPAPYPVGGLRLDGAGHDAAALLDGWDLHPARVGAGVRAGSATLAVSLPPRMRGRPLSLEATAIGSGHLALRVNGRDLPTSTSGRTVTTRVPAELVAAYRFGRLVVDVDRTDDHRVRLLTLRLRAVGA